MSHAGDRRWRTAGHHDRRYRRRQRFLDRATRTDRRRRDSVRLLHPGVCHCAHGTVRARAAAWTRADPQRAVRQSLPLFGLRKDHRGGGTPRRRSAMTIGLNPPRLEAADKATGRAQYVEDIQRPGMLYAALVTSPHAHARIVSSRVDAARAMPGVKAIVAGDDLKGPRSGGMIKD